VLYIYFADPADPFNPGNISAKALAEANLLLATARPRGTLRLQCGRVKRIAEAKVDYKSILPNWGLQRARRAPIIHILIHHGIVNEGTWVWVAASRHSNSSCGSRS